MQGALCTESVFFYFTFYLSYTPPSYGPGITGKDLVENWEMTGEYWRPILESSWISSAGCFSSDSAFYTIQLSFPTF